MEIYAEWCGEYRRQYATVLTYSKLPLQGIGPALACVTGVKMGGEEEGEKRESGEKGRELILSPQSLVSLVCPKVADEANLGVEPSSISWTHVNWGGLPVACKSGLARLAFLFYGVSFVVFGFMGSGMNEVAPGWTVGIEKTLRNKQ